MRRRSGALVLVLVAALAGAALSRADFDLGSAGGLTYVRNSAPVGTAPSTASTRADCPAAKHAVGGGAIVSLPASEAYVGSTYPSTGPTPTPSPTTAGGRASRTTPVARRASTRRSSAPRAAPPTGRIPSA